MDVLELNDAIDRLARLDERAARVVELRFFAGLTIAQVAAVLEVSDFTVENDWRAATGVPGAGTGPRPAGEREWGEWGSEGSGASGGGGE